MHQTNAYSDEYLASLRNEVELLENVTWVAIEDLEQKLNNLTDISPIDEENWSSRLNSVEIYTMEEIVPLSDSIRQIEIH